MTRSQLEQLPTKELVALYNKATGKSTKKFASRSKGIEQTLRALKDNPAAAGKKEQGARRSAGMSFRLKPHEKQKTPREGTKRARVLAMISRDNGALFSEIREECGWNLKDAYEGVRLLNVFCGHGLWHEPVQGTNDYRIFAVDKATFEQKVREANARA